MADLQMRRFQTRVLKSDGGNQVPAYGSGFQVYRQGATVKTTVQLQPGVSTRVYLFDSGRWEIPDRLLLNGDPAKPLDVDAWDLDGQWMDVVYRGSSTVTAQPGDRLVLVPWQKQVAAVSAPACIQPLHTAHVAVYNLGNVNIDDQLRVEASTTARLGVVAIDPNRLGMTLENQSASTVSLQVDQHLLKESDPLPLWLDTQGTTEFAARTLDVNGATAFHCMEDRFDVFFSDVPSSPPLMIDVPGGWIRTGVTWVNGRDYPNLQAALDACPTGGTLFIPAGDYIVPSGGLKITRQLALRGEPGTRLHAHARDFNQPVVWIDPGSNYLFRVELHCLTLRNAVPPPLGQKLSGNYGLRCDITEAGGKVTELLLDKVTVEDMGDDGIHLHGTDDGDRVFVFVALRDVMIGRCRGSAAFISGAYGVSCVGSYFNGSDECGVWAEFSEPAFYGCGFEGNCRSNDLPVLYRGQAYVRGCGISRFDGCHFENFATASQPVNRHGLTIEDSPCCVVSGCYFFNESELGEAHERGIYCTASGDNGPGVVATAFLPNAFHNVKTAIEIEAGYNEAKDCVVFPQRIHAGTGAMILPTGLAQNGLVTLGSKRCLDTEPVDPEHPETTGPQPVPLGLCVPAVAGSDFRPDPELLQDKHHGTVLFDHEIKRLIYWDGTSWRAIATA